MKVLPSTVILFPPSPSLLGSVFEKVYNHISLNSSSKESVPFYVTLDRKDSKKKKKEKIPKPKS